MIDWIKKHLPSHESLRQHKMLQFLKHRLGEPRLWHFNRQTVPPAVFAGIFAGYLPIPFQMIVGAFLAVRLRCNLPLSVALVWFSNPLTYVPVFYPAYKLGAWILGMDTFIPRPVEFGWVLQQFIPLWLGSIICGLFFGAIGYLLTRYWWWYRARTRLARHQALRLSHRPKSTTMNEADAKRINRKESANTPPD